MVGERARAETGMAALARRIAILDFVEQSWNSWIEKSALFTPEGTFLEECDKNVKKTMETTSLKKEDMSIYGHCPAHDDFFLVVCIHCSRLVKPQAFERHCESRHGPFSKLYDLSSNCSPDRPQPGEPPSQHGSLCEGQDRRHQDARHPIVPPPCSPHLRRSKPQREVHSIQQVDNIFHGKPASPSYFSTPGPGDPHHWGTTPPKASPPAEKPLQKSLDFHSPHHGARTYSRTYKHVLKVTEEGFAQVGPQWTPLHSKCQITNTSVLRSMTPSDSAVEMEQKVMRYEELQVESLSAGFSSEENDNENREEFVHLPVSTCHPKPLGFCTFGACVLGRSMLAFDRRLLHLRSAFTAMIKQHLSAYLSKKMPQVSELCSYQPIVTTNTYNLNNATNVPRPSHKNPSLRTCASVNSELQPTNLTTPYKLPTKSQSVSGPGRSGITVGHTSKQSLQATFRKLQDSPTSSKRQKSPLGDEKLPRQGKILYRTATSSPNGPLNGTPGSKPRPSVYTPEIKGLIKQKPSHMPTHMTSPPPSESVEGEASGLNHRTLGYEHKGRKRKTSSGSLPKITSCASKSSILFSLSQTHSSLASWGGDGRPDSNSHTVPKRLGAQKKDLSESTAQISGPPPTGLVMGSSFPPLYTNFGSQLERLVRDHNCP
ncbi:Ataxin-7-like protein 2 [Triplophysa tibetana]|uniref:Ataxin-7-like protein 2 n=1 Tax=Triplophysa tibetana TaxID=1572043 RepID=A0A5A9NZ03_9TELE|nr:Ataxin-7-like protein 2 [Triplophysa tibetana]